MNTPQETMKDIEDLSIERLVNDYTVTLESLTNSLHSNTISRLEYNELVEDLADLVRIKCLTATVKHKAMFSQLVDLLKTALK